MMGPMGRPPMGGPRGPRRGQGGPQEMREPKRQEVDLETIDEESERMLELRMLRAENAKFERTEGGFLNLYLAGQVYEKVQLIRMFPNSDPEVYLSVREDGDRARELGVIADLKRDFDAETVNAIREQLRIRYFTPVIREIASIKEEAGCAYFVVRTDYGECKFAIRTNNNAVIRLGEHRIFIQDLENNRFEIPDLTKLTQKEQRRLDMFL